MDNHPDEGVQNDKRVLTIPIDEQIQINVNSLTTICETFCEKYEAVDPLHEIIPENNIEVRDEDGVIDPSMIEMQMTPGGKVKRRYSVILELTCIISYLDVLIYNIIEQRGSLDHRRYKSRKTGKFSFSQ